MNAGGSATAASTPDAPPDLPRPFAFGLTLFVTTRVGVLLVGWLAVLAIGYPVSRDHTPTVSHDEMLNLPARWDAFWYQHIARSGYRDMRSEGQQDVVFFPLYPVLMGAAGEGLAKLARVTGRPRMLENGNVRVLWGGVLISLTAFALALGYSYKLARMDLEKEQAQVAMALLATYPFALFYSAAYTEALFLLGALGAIYHFRIGDALPAAAWGLMVGLTRPNGCFLSVPLALLWLGMVWPAAASWTFPRRQTLVEGPDRISAGRAAAFLLVAAMPGIGMLMYSCYAYQLTGDPFIWIEAQRAWGRHRTMVPFAWEAKLVHDLGFYSYAASHPFNVVNTLGALAAVAAIWPVARRFGMAYAAFVAINILPPLATGQVTSAGRFTSVLFPMFLYGATVLTSRRRLLVVAVFATLQGFAAALFFTWRQLF